MTRPFSEADPFTQALERQWYYVERQADLAELIPPGNRIKLFGADRSPEKEGHQAADYPELRIAPAGAVTDIQLSTTSAIVTQLYTYEVATGDRRATILMPINWALIRAVSEMDNVNLDLDFVDRLEVQSIEQASQPLTPQSTELTMMQWIGLIEVNITMIFTITSDLQG